MKIRAIELNNVRRFQGQTARIDGISDGVTTICAPNESGKSTFFDALYAVFFIEHKSSAQEIRSLQPYAKGSVGIAVEIEREDGIRYRIAKRYLSSKAATITDLSTGRIIAQEGEAEAWINNLIGMDLSGPAGLLWVRQGITGFGPDGTGTRERGERERLKQARQTLMSSVAGQIDSVTGGQRMDAIMRACEEDYDKIATKTGQPKAGGEWHKARKEADDLEEECQRLEAQVSELALALRERRTLKEQLRQLEDPDAAEVRDTAIEGAKKALEAAENHDRKIADSDRDLRLSMLDAKSVEDRIAQSDKATERLGQLRRTSESCRKTLSDAAAELSGATAARDDAWQKLQDAKTRAAVARQVLRDGEATARSAQAHVRRREIEAILGRLEGFEEKIKTCDRELGDIKVTPEALKHMEALEQRLSLARKLREAGMASFRLDYTGTQKISGNDGTPLEGGATHLLEVETTLTLPGLGTLHLMPPAQAQEGSDIDGMARELAEALTAASLSTLQEARLALERRHDLLAQKTIALQSIEALAPEGSDKLRRELASLPEPLAEGAAPEEVPDLAKMKDAQEEAESSEQQAQSAYDSAAAAHQGSERRQIAAATAAEIAQEALEAPVEGLLSEEDKSAIMADLAEKRIGITRQQESLAELRAAAPDRETIEADLTRLRSARTEIRRQIDATRGRLQNLSGTIQARAEDGVETRLEEAREELSGLRAREARYAHEAAVLEALKTELEKARKEARDAYFEPVRKEIGPLLAMLHEGAEFEMDPDTMLPARIVRNGISEEIDVLSGGAAEQIAILTRLAFARLYARNGKSVPVVLDDALIHSDDERIVRMFTALTRGAKDQQIIVFSCRNRAFMELGGVRPMIEVVQNAA